MENTHDYDGYHQVKNNKDLSSTMISMIVTQDDNGGDLRGGLLPVRGPERRRASVFPNVSQGGKF